MLCWPGEWGYSYPYASAPVTITTDVKSLDSTLTDWTLDFAVGDIFEFVLSSVTDAKWAKIILLTTKD